MTEPGFLEGFVNRVRMAAGAAVFAAASIGSVLTAAGASAAATTAAAGYNGVCGRGYQVVNSAPIGRKATVYLTYNPATGRNCVVTQRSAAGPAVWMSAWVQLVEDHESTPVVDSGKYTSYAGPVYLPARGYCVNWGGSAENQDVEVDHSNCGKTMPTSR
ncbi:spore-associated protein A [Streptomyces sp. B1866]|uniref:spore-associated protein A n=1 Tax=Streptomyces sp. B1866 TaxID=3075431 RepID=UPI00289051A1|nr:spore-associated protein A [Streptomyces sp. B1866]MDT3398106.1 spore-associated protein A [Streptomyces sp. B1866]